MRDEAARPRFRRFVTRCLVAAAAQRCVSMVVLDVEAEECASLYPRKLVLSRPDQHVAWRGDEPPEDSLGLIDRVRGSSCRS
jgi:Aromatic-ring hydroxylase, C-terminal